jgi:hypothetical protein
LHQAWNSTPASLLIAQQERLTMWRAAKTTTIVLIGLTLRVVVLVAIARETVAERQRAWTA